MNDELPSNPAIPIDVAFYVFPQFQLLDLSGPLAAFQLANALSTPEGLFNLRVGSRLGGSIHTSAGLGVETFLVSEFLKIDTLIVVGGAGALEPCKEELDTIRALSSRTRRVASVCTGAFFLAGCGLLDGRSATTHWRYAARLQRDYPRLKVNADKIYSKDGPFWTSAGITAGIDLALAMIEADYGLDMAKSVARELIVEYRRPGGQTQHSEMLALQAESDRIQDVLVYIRRHLNRPLDVEHLADIASLSLRHFNRLFKQQTGETPAKAVERIRLETARTRVESSIEPIESIADTVGFSDPERMRRAFIRHFGHPPQSFRRIAFSNLRGKA